MKKIQKIELKQLVEPGNTNSISGRSFGEGFADKIRLLSLLENYDTVDFIIDGDSIKAINDSFIKGLFSKVFDKYKTVDEVKKHVEITSSDYFKKLFEKNWFILQQVNNV